MAGNKFRLALIQLAVGASKPDNLQKATQFVEKAAKEGAKIVALPECCNSPYGNAYFAEYSETIPGQSSSTFAKAAKDNQVYLVAGSIPENDNGKLYNTCTVFNPAGEMISKFRKLHLFDIDIPGKITFKESETLSAGQQLCSFDTGFCKVGVGICYDIRFAEIAQIYRKQGCQLLLYPGAFNMTTGPAHWELLQRARALDNQFYVGAISPARDMSATYNAWGHTSLVNPWGDVIATCDEKESIVYADIDLDYMNEVRNQIPISHQRREDIYDVTTK